ncbi:uncharacterized protein [Engystomops pustulosus]|uniref:uncharacterized protein n=1 Tax=Engystomops pustulosus TaxID=76066 RepID=UPI003AFACA6E
MKVLTSLALLVAALIVGAQGSGAAPGQLQRSGHLGAGRRRVMTPPLRLTPRGRKKSIWSYKPGHRSLAFLVAGGVDTVSPPPLEPGTGDYRCLGCCGVRVTIMGPSTSAPKISNRVSGLHPPGPEPAGTEPNAINDRCLGCCEETVTPSLRATTPTQKRITNKERATARKPRPRETPRPRPHVPPPCTPPKCNPTWRYEDSSSSEEMPLITRLRSGGRCRHLGCRSALGGAPDSSSSSEED